MRILVTGGAGFIGSHLADSLLERGHEVAIIDDFSSGSHSNLPAGARLYEVDVRDSAPVRAAFEDFRPEAVAHQAAQMSVSCSVRDPGFDAKVNILGLINIAAAAVDVGTRRFVFASSGGTLYGEVQEPATEEMMPAPISPYGLSKWAGEKYLQFFQREYDLSVVSLRYANVYGERQNPHGEAGVVAIFCTRLLRGETATINGDGKYLRDYVHVSDVVRSNVAALEGETDGFEAVNVGTGIGTDVNELAQKIRKFCEAELIELGMPRQIAELEHGPARPGDIRANLVAFDKGRELWKLPEPVVLEEGLRQTVHWFANQMPAARRD